MTKLNLGCGSAYRPGYVNIDRSRRSVADLLADAEDLPFESNSVETIEAIQLLEHFDLVHCKYVLSEWFRVLTPGGTLSIETPDLKASLRDLSSRKKKDRASAIQWLFGIDSPGLQHKGGFTFDLLEETLAGIGYEHISRKPAKTHVYAPGMRVECMKPAAPGAAQFMASLRKRIRRHLGIHDSFILIPLEQELAKIRSEILEPPRVSRERARSVAALASVWNPSIAIAFLEECSEARIVEAQDSERDFRVLRQLSEMKFHERILTLWMKSRKGADSEKEFASFTDRTAQTVRRVLDRPELGAQLLDYIASLQPTPIELFDLSLIKQRANALLNSGILRFHKGDLTDAEQNLTESLRWDPQNPLAHWNLARIGIAAMWPSETVRHHYAEAYTLLGDSRTKERLDRERRAFASQGRQRIEAVPLSEYDLLR